MRTSWDYWMKFGGVWGPWDCSYQDAWNKKNNNRILWWPLNRMYSQNGEYEHEINDPNTWNKLKRVITVS